MALLLGIKALGLKGEIITTPYSFVATTHVISWNGLKPVFCDIDENTLNISPKNIEPLINEKTSAILATNVYGRPCDFNFIEKIAQKYNLKVIYDSAHAFGVEDEKQSILNYGDLSILSFHGTKVFTTFEGGAVVSQNNKNKDKLDKLKNFAYNGETSIVGHGINAKMNEFQSALGVLQLKHVENYINIRRSLWKFYINELQGIEGIEIKKFPKNIKNNFSYFPIFVDEEKYGISRDELYHRLINKNIFARRYFYPLISDFKPYSNNRTASHETLPAAYKVSRSVICLPLHTHLNRSNIIKISNIIKSSYKN